MFGTLFSFDIQIFLIIVFLLIILLYILSIVWTIRDARGRGANAKLWGFVSIIPFAGVIAYILMRPPLLACDKLEQDLDVLLTKYKLMDYGKCNTCGCAVKTDFIACPICGQKLKDVCSKCGKPLDLNWKICPYCGVQTRFSSTNIYNND